MVIQAVPWGHAMDLAGLRLDKRHQQYFLDEYMLMSTFLAYSSFL